MIILQTKTNLLDEDFQKLYRTIYNMKENGLIILPPGIEVVHISEREKPNIVIEDGLCEPPELLKKRFNMPEKEEKRYCEDCAHYCHFESFDFNKRTVVTTQWCGKHTEKFAASNTKACEDFMEKEKGNE